MRRLFIGLIVLIVIFSGIFLWMFSQLNTLVESAIEETGTEITETNVEVDGVAITLTDGQAVIKGLTIANPLGYSENAAFSLSEISAVLDPDKTTRELVIIKELKIMDPVISYELGNLGSNIDTIRNAVNKNVGSGGGSASSFEPRFIIDRLVIGKGQIKLSAVNERDASTDFPEIRLNNIGAKQGGATGAEIGEIIVSELTQNALSIVARGALDKYLDEAKEDVKGAIDKLFGND